MFFSVRLDGERLKVVGAAMSTTHRRKHESEEIFISSEAVVVWLMSVAALSLTEAKAAV